MLNVRKFASHMLISISKLNGLTIMRNSNLTGEMWPTESCFSLGKIHVFICELNGFFCSFASLCSLTFNTIHLM